MDEALHEARIAHVKNEVPVGAVLRIGNEIVGRGHNGTIESSDPTAHAEILALREACQKQKNYRLPGSILYVTLEPCLMCAGALLQARVAEVVFGAREPVGGAAGSIMNVLESGWLSHCTKVTAGIGAEESKELLQQFFERLRSTQGRVRS
jgi:tRNA(adenine34) deaminase